MAKAKGLYKRGEIWWICYAGPDGRIIRESSQSKSCREAEAFLLQRKVEVREGKLNIPKRIASHTFNDLADVYLKGFERQRAYRTKKGTVLVLQKEWGYVPLSLFTTMSVEGYQSKMLNRGCAPASANRHLAIIKHMFKKAVEWEMVSEEVQKKVQRVKLSPVNNRRLRYLSVEECNALIDACASHLQPIVIAALQTGARKEEVLSLRWDQVDLRHGYILLEKTKNNERREIPINSILRQTLMGLVRRLDSPYVFADTEGRRFKDIKKSFHAALKKAGIRDFRFHDLRHTFASHLVMAGVDLATVRELLGHKDISMTLRYAKLSAAHKAKATTALEGIFKGEPTSQLLHNHAVMQG